MAGGRAPKPDRLPAREAVRQAETGTMLAEATGDAGWPTATGCSAQLESQWREANA
jgi:hypothetical protein